MRQPRYRLQLWPPVLHFEERLMKKKTKKLELSKDTLRRLAEAQLTEAAGGRPPATLTCAPESAYPCW